VLYASLAQLEYTEGFFSSCSSLIEEEDLVGYRLWKKTVNFFNGAKTRSGTGQPNGFPKESLQHMRFRPLLHGQGV